MEISIITPVYKAEKYIIRCVDSILGQTFKDFELILVDDGSLDQSGDICDQYAEKDDRVRVIHQKNGGAAAARNTGLDAASGQWIAFIDSDDWVHPEYLRIMYETAMSQHADVVACRYKTVYEDEGSEDDLETACISADNREDYWVDDRIGAVAPWGKLYRRELFEDLRFPIGRTAEDEFITHQLIFGCNKLIVLDNTLYRYYYANNDSVTHSNYLGRMRDSQEALRQHIVYFENTLWQKAYRAEVGYYAEVWAVAIRLLKKQRDPEAKKTIAKYRAELREFLSLYRNLLPNEKRSMLYEVAYPSAELYFRGIRFMKRILKHE